MTKRNNLKKQLADDFLNSMSEFLTLIGVDDDEQKQRAKDFVNDAEQNASGSSDASLKKSFKAALKAEVERANDALRAAFALVSVQQRSSGPARQDMRAPDQPKSFSLPSSGKFPTC